MAADDDRTTKDRTDRAAQAYNRLRKLIVHGQLAPGSRIIETEVAERLGVSRTPVRSALQRLQQEGFIVEGRNGERGRGSVSPLTREDARELFQIVGALEGLAAAHPARLSPRERDPLVDRLEDANRKLHALEATQHPNRSSYFDLDSAFHQVYVDAGAGPRLGKLHEVVKPQAERYIRTTIQPSPSLRARRTPDSPLLAAIRPATLVAALWLLLPAVPVGAGATGPGSASGLAAQTLDRADATYDLVIRNGRVLDGAGNPWIAADVGIRDGRIARVGHIVIFDLEQVRDRATYRVLSGPGRKAESEGSR